MVDVKRTRERLQKDLGDYEEILKQAYKASIRSVEHFQDWIFGTFKELGMEAEEFRVAGHELNNQPAFRRTYSDPESMAEGPKNIVGYLNKAATDGILLYAHADKKPETYEYGKNIPDVVERDGKYFGGGIADDVSGLAAMLSAVKLFLDLGYKPEQKILVASILGKQGGVFGTYGLMRRYGPMRAAIYMHPAESGEGLRELKTASNGLIEFELSVAGKHPDSTEVHQSIFSTSAVSAVDKLCYVHGQLQRWAARQSRKYHHDALHELTGQSFALTVGKIECGEENETFEIPVKGTMKGTLAFSPKATLPVVQKELEDAVQEIASSDPWLSRGNCSLSYGDRIGEAAESDLESRFVTDSVDVIKAFTGKAPKYFYGHSMSDIRYPLLDWKAEAAYGIGPLSGDLGRESEWVDKEEYLLSIAILTEIMHRVAG